MKVSVHGDMENPSEVPQSSTILFFAKFRRRTNIQYLVALSASLY